MDSSQPPQGSSSATHSPATGASILAASENLFPHPSLVVALHPVMTLSRVEMRTVLQMFKSSPREFVLFPPMSTPPIIPFYLWKKMPPSHELISFVLLFLLYNSLCFIIHHGFSSPHVVKPSYSQFPLRKKIS